MSFVEVLPEGDLWIGEMRQVTVGNRRVLLLRTERGVFAYEDRCPHLGVPLSRGCLNKETITCGGHHYQFDASTGHGQNPKNLRLVVVSVECRQGKILVEERPDVEAR